MSNLKANPISEASWLNSVFITQRNLTGFKQLLKFEAESEPSIIT